MLTLCWACGVTHPAFITGDVLEVLDGRLHGTSVREFYGYAEGWGRPSGDRASELLALMKQPAPWRHPG
jgi:hypothetical protein